MKIYCIHCSFPNVYSITRPNICAQCAKKLEDLSVFAEIEENKEIDKNTKNKIKNIKKELNTKEKIRAELKSDALKSKSRRIEIEDEEMEEEEEFIIPDKLDVEIVNKGNTNKGISLGELAKQQKTGFIRPTPKSFEFNKEKWQQIAGNNKKAIEIEDNLENDATE